MRRDVDALARGEFDVLVIGGGMHGAWIALRAIQAGCSVALIEKADFAAATSANSLKILHGGLRYLQNLDLPRMRSSIAARRQFARQSPHLFQPLPCVMPLRPGGLKNPLTLGGALLANDLLSADRNVGVAGNARLPAGRLISGANCRKALSPLVTSDAVAGALWWDGLAGDTARLALEPLLCAADAGAVVANRVEALRYQLVDSRVVGVEARDVLEERSFAIRARTVINATGPWIAELSRKAGLPTHALPQAWTAGMNIVLRRSLGIDRAVALSGKSGANRQRELFLVPWRGVTMVGTHYEPLESVGDLGGAPPRKVVESFVRDVAAVAPHARVSMQDVALVHWGALPLAAPGDELPAKRPFLVSGLDATGARGLVLLSAEKLTSAPWLSQRVLESALREMPSSPTMRMQFTPPAAEPDPAVTLSVPPQVAARLQSRYGSKWQIVLQHAAIRPELLLPVASATGVLAVEVVHAIREEMAVTLDDLVSRRLGLADAGHPGLGLLRAVAAVAAAEWGLQPQGCERLVADFPMRACE